MAPLRLRPWPTRVSLLERALTQQRLGGARYVTMASNKHKISLLIAALTLLWQTQISAQAYDSHKQLLAKRGTSTLKPLVPVEDLDSLPDVGEISDKAVKEYAAGHLPQAEKLFEQVLKYDPSNADAHFNLGAIKEWRNDLTSALAHYKAAYALKPNDSEIRDAVQAVQFKIKNKPALDAQAARSKRAQDLTNHGQLAKDSFAAQNYSEAVTHLSFLAQAMPEDAKIQFALGQSLRALKYFDWAAYRLKMAIYLDPDNDLYRKTIVELDKEIQEAQAQAYAESADMALRKMAPFSFMELADGPRAKGL